MNENERKNKILELLLDGKTVKKRVFSEMCECSERTIQRTVKVLEADGWNIVGLNDGYFLEKPREEDLIKTENEHLATLVLAGSLG